MEFDRVQGEGVDGRDILQQRFPCFAREAQDEMAADRNPPRGRFPHGPFRAGEIMPPVHPPEGFVPGGLDPVLHPRAAQRSDVIQLLRVHAVRPGADDDTFDRRVRQRFPVHRLQAVKGRKRVGK